MCEWQSPNVNLYTLTHTQYVMYDNGKIINLPLPNGSRSYEGLGHMENWERLVAQSTASDPHRDTGVSKEISILININRENSNDICTSDVATVGRYSATSAKAN